MNKILKKCVLCGKEARTEYLNNAQPLAEGECCDSCNIGRVVPTRLNGGKSSHWGYKRDDSGKWVTYPVRDKESTGGHITCPNKEEENDRNVIKQTRFAYLP